MLDGYNNDLQSAVYCGEMLDGYNQKPLYSFLTMAVYCGEMLDGYNYRRLSVLVVSCLLWRNVGWLQPYDL